MECLSTQSREDLIEEKGNRVSNDYSNKGTMKFKTIDGGFV